jgi:hypothetical protein
MRNSKSLKAKNWSSMMKSLKSLKTKNWNSMMRSSSLTKKSLRS